MTIRVIERKAQNQLYRERCGFCDSLVGFEAGDAFKQQLVLGIDVIIDCPVCGFQMRADAAIPYRPEMSTEPVVVA